MLENDSMPSLEDPIMEEDGMPPMDDSEGISSN
jgi:hypothetical protein